METVIRSVMHISPHSWDLKPATEYPDGGGGVDIPLEMDIPAVEERCRKNCYEWLPRMYNEEQGAFYGYYDPRFEDFADPQTANLIAPWQLMAIYDRYGDEEKLACATSAATWLHENMVDSHPMSLVLGGIQDNIKEHQVWTKYTGDYVVTNLGLFQRTEDEQHLRRALQSGKFLLQAQRHDFAPLYDRWNDVWLHRGWQSFGRTIGALLGLWEVTEDDNWLEWATEWADYALDLQAENGCFHLINNQYYSSDIAADEIRSLLLISEHTGEERYAEAAADFADWHLRHQRADGAWYVAMDRYDVPVSDYVGPGDVPNLGISLLRLHDYSGDTRYLTATIKAMRYALSTQVLPEEDHPFSGDPHLDWGFWSWDPCYDHTVSPDQSTHQVRGLWFFIDYWLSLDEDVRVEAMEALPEDLETQAPVRSGCTRPESQ